MVSRLHTRKAPNQLCVKVPAGRLPAFLQQRQQLVAGGAEPGAAATVDARPGTARQECRRGEGAPAAGTGAARRHAPPSGVAARPWPALTPHPVDTAGFRLGNSMRGRGVVSQWQHTMTACQSRHGLWGLRHQIEGCQCLLHIVRQRARCRQLVNGAHTDSLSVRSCAANFHPIMKAL